MARGRFGAGQLIAVLIVAVLGLYLVSNFMVQGAEGWEFDIPGDVSDMSLTLMKLAIIGLMVFAGYALVSKFRGTRMSRGDVMMLILVGAAVYFMWPYLETVLELADLDDITFVVGQKLGFFG